jgi:hypothetical protein
VTGLLAEVQREAGMLNGAMDWSLEAPDWPTVVALFSVVAPVVIGRGGVLDAEQGHAAAAFHESISPKPE